MLALVDADVLLYLIGYTTEEEDVEIAYLRMNDKIADIILATDATDYRLFLSDSAENNFRYKINPEYKSNRTQPKPRHYEALKEFLIVKHNAQIAYGMEADDAMAINQAEDTIICTIDKDLDTIPGKHYKWEIWRKGTIVKEAQLYEVNELEAIRFFYKQMLIGDTADAIKGITGIGKKGADKLLDPCTTPEEMFNIVSEKYVNEFGDNWQDQMEMTGKLLWILRHDEDSYQLPNQTEGVRETK
jgi:5'-3' exonuclease